jgi:O-antigen ligase
MPGRLSLPDPRLLVGIAAAFAAVLLGVLTGIDPKLGLAAAVGLAFVGVVLGDLFVGFAVMVLFAYMETLSTLQGVSLAKVAGVVIAGSWLAVMTSGRRDVRNPFDERPGLMYLLLLFIGWALVSVGWSEFRGEAISSVVRYGLNAVLIPIAYTAVSTRRDAVRVFAVIVAGAAVAAVSGIVDAPSASAYDVARASGTAGDPNELAAALVMGFCLAVAFAVNRHIDVRGRMAAAVTAGLCLLAIALSLSRGGLLGLAFAGIVAIVVAGRWRPQVLGAVALVGVLGVGWFAVLADAGARDRVLHNTGGSTGRLDLWTIGTRMVEAHPIRGVGTGQYITASVHYLVRPGAFQRGDLVLIAPKVAHNTYLGTAAELGLVGAALLLALMIACGRSAWQAVRTFAADRDERLEILGRGFLVGAAGYAASLLFISENYKKVLWLFLALGPVLLSVSRKDPKNASAGDAAG